MSSSGLDPTGPSQPNLDTAYKVAGNPATKEPVEQAQAYHKDDSASIEKRVPSEQAHDQSEATPTSVARGIRGAPPGEEVKGETHESVGRNKELDGEQMAAPGEGKVADVVDRKPGATGAAPDLASDLDRKKEEQQEAREEIEEQKKEEVDVAGVLSNRGGPANPVDKGGYPNSDYK
ncbi:hypothetical protein AUEXF2481DRAFT_7716 [Aureobasidium subglaciale EXF-2481]|uniref:Uncharacterized protein n=1 Tax=Aureobasidium subglaciale (strain EXF-2481) TaxID=1043005 RepID=A0A074Y8J8_AURSE|nr:uncharacterized protein AUEXF2481DRAFT_7716 [Aureobasidium subglaciale EXF-2481]KAI5202220.1 hypothetical protein E4T38_05739 [Aureobasidium subglaciale]KAI5221150.1 hypothetical protein E4T40_05624 [Aureobasidium subglaciale]KAI5224414.1 hypothetical protein E4T41_05718 [Aureobasidium subglaciale]KAI5261011.1 hypothetical protein E4T46_05493 [Aureobasidium subglaciale]KEQ92319.1 hypothetical protein AUEXF2481DRAFT_7716 [Aureobasidium subglaciale EXF-2481]